MKRKVPCCRQMVTSQNMISSFGMASRSWGFSLRWTKYVQTFLPTVQKKAVGYPLSLKFLQSE